MSGALMNIKNWLSRLSRTRSETTSGPPDWMGFIQSLVNDGLITEKEVAESVLGCLNPPQVGTSIASKSTFQRSMPPKKAWEGTKNWFYDQTGKCATCGTRMNLEADHVVSRKDGGEDVLDNLVLRCRRHNSSRRHANGGITDLTTQAALMYIMLSARPKTYKEYERLCREYGLTCSNIRFQEAWAMAVWIRKDRNEVTDC